MGSLADLPYALASMDGDFISPSHIQALIWHETVPVLLADAVVPRWWHVSRDELQHVYYRFVALADRKKNIYDQDLIGLLPEKIRENRQEPVAELD